MRLRIATAFALLFFVALAGVLIRVSHVLPEAASDAALETAPFTFDTSGIDGKKAMEILRDFLAISPRDSGTKGSARAADFISSHLTNSGLTPSTDAFEDRSPKGTTTFRNVTAAIEGNGKACIVLISHYDTKSGMPPGFTGANDSGSSTALLLHLANVMQPSAGSVPDIVFAFVDGEECMERYSASDGLHGSRRLAESLTKRYGKENIEAAIVLDMIGDQDLTLTIPRNSTPELIQRVFAAAGEENVRSKFSLYGPILDDHVPFLNLGIPAIDIIDFYFGSAPRKNDYWHTAEDCIDKISPASLELVGQITVKLVNSLIAQPLEN